MSHLKEPMDLQFGYWLGGFSYHMELIDFKEIGVSKQEAYGSTEVYR
jgi:hypothetical protein